MQRKNYTFRARPAVEGMEEIENQLRKAHRYRNRLCEIELKRREDYDAMLRKLAPKYVAAVADREKLLAELEAIRTTIKARSAKARKRVPVEPEERRALDDLKKQLTEANKALKELKIQVRERADVQEASARLSKQFAETRKKVRKESGLFWGTYLTVDAACADFGSGPPPKFRGYRDEGTVSVQIQNGMPVEKLLAGSDSRVQLFLELDASGKPLKRQVLRLRVGGTGKDQIHARIPFVMHRQFPEGTIINWVHLHKRKVASNVYWDLGFAISMPSAVREASEALVAAHFGWRKLDDGSLRVMCWRGSDGESGEFVIPKYRVDGCDIPDRLRGIRDKIFNEVRPALIAWLDALKADGKTIPEPIAEARKVMHLWKSPRALARLLFEWEKVNASWPEGQQKFIELNGQKHVPREGWRKKDKHLWLWECHQRKNFVAWRKNAYRVLARQLANKYRRVAIMFADWAEMRKKMPVERKEEEGQTAAMRRNSAIAAVSTFADIIKQAFGADTVLKSGLQYITADCAKCGHRNETIDREMHYTCRNCNLRFDVDKNAVENQLADAMEEVSKLPAYELVMADRIASNSGQKSLSKRQQAMRDAKARNKAKKDREATLGGAS